MKQYLDVMRTVAEEGRFKGNRTGVRTKARFSEKFRCDLRNGFPLLTTKKVNFAKVVGELFAFLNGADKVSDFHKFDCDIWDPWGLEADHYRMVNITEDQYPELLVEHLGLTLDEANQRLSKLKTQYDEWLVLRDKYVLEGDEAKLNEHLGEQPSSPTDYMREQKISLFKREVIYPEGYLGPIYGKQWTEWRTSTGEIINQLARIANQLETTPNSRRIILTGWNPEVIPADKYTHIPFTNIKVVSSSDNIQAAIMDGKQALPPCHLLTVFNVTSEEDEVDPVLNLHLTMRSTDVPIGLPFNIAFYALFLMIAAKQYEMIAGELVIEMVDCHIYEDQLDLVKVQLERTPTDLPTLTLPDGIRFHDRSTITRENYEAIVAGLSNYNPQPFIKYPVAV